MNVVFSKEADSDLVHILTYLADRNRVAAQELADRINSRLESLGHFPFIGRDRSLLAEGLRSVAVEHCVIFYRAEQQRILIVRVLDGRRDIDAEFERGP